MNKQPMCLCFWLSISISSVLYKLFTIPLQVAQSSLSVHYCMISNKVDRVFKMSHCMISVAFSKVFFFCVSESENRIKNQMKSVGGPFYSFPQLFKFLQLIGQKVFNSSKQQLLQEFQLQGESQVSFL